MAPEKEGGTESENSVSSAKLNFRTPSPFILLCLLLVVAGEARAQEGEQAEPRRAVVVLAYRAGSAALPDMDRHLASILQQKTSLAVIDPDDARRRYGDQLDAEVVTCAGDTACIARIGRAVGAADVLLVGISRFGDIILTVQRIDARGGRVRARIAEALPPGEAAPDERALLGYLRRVMPRRDFLRFGIIRIDADVDGATVRVAGEDRGRTPLAPLRVAAPATYDIRVDKPGFLSFEASVAVPPDAEVVVQPRLSRRDHAWYGHWWVAAIAGTAAAGAVAIYAVTRDADDVPVVIQPF